MPLGRKDLSYEGLGRARRILIICSIYVSDGEYIIGRELIPAVA